MLYYTSTNTRLKGFENPIVVDNKNDIDGAINIIPQTNLIEYFMLQRAISECKFYKFLGVEFHYMK